MNIFMIDMVFFISGICFVIISITLFYAKHRMHKEDRRLRDDGVLPSGSQISHGMERNLNERGVIGVTEMSTVYHSRLL